MPRAYVHDPDAVLDYTIDWSLWLDGDSIDESTWTVSDDAMTVGDEILDGALTQAWLSGGTPGLTARVTNHIVTAGGRADDRTLLLTVRSR